LLHNEGFALFDAALEDQKDHPNEEVIYCFLRSAELQQQAVAALDDQNDHDRIDRARYLSNVGLALFDAAKKAQEN
jgi:hypothetical protein